MNNELYHHGIKGMHWGVRRFQRYNGQRTSGGKKKDDDIRFHIGRRGFAIARTREGRKDARKRTRRNYWNAVKPKSVVKRTKNSKGKTKISFKQESTKQHLSDAALYLFTSKTMKMSAGIAARRGHAYTALGAEALGLYGEVTGVAHLAGAGYNVISKQKKRASSTQSHK